jgi:hypothetical protein
VTWIFLWTQSVVESAIGISALDNKIGGNVCDNFIDTMKFDQVFTQNGAIEHLLDIVRILICMCFIKTIGFFVFFARNV